jgi:lipid-A-disaccharide synthase
MVVDWVNKSKMPIKVISEKDLDPSVFEFQKKVLFSTSLAAVATSGTVSLELARMGSPMVIAYRASVLTEFLYKLLIKVKSATLINILTSRMDIDEFLFRQCTFKNLSMSLNSILTDTEVVKKQIIASNEAMVLLGLGGEDPKTRAAKSIINFIKRNK